jgi:molybdopterin/thiamine biosynthesis adenylyltransferase
VTALADAQVERYSRQILLPEVGGRGQERLFAGAVALAGAGPAVAAAATLLGRAGVGRLALADDAPELPELAPECLVGRGTDGDVVVDLSGDLTASVARGRHAAAAGRPFVVGTLRGARATVATLVGRPCVACLASAEPPGAPDAGPLAAPAALALGALAASEALRLLLLPGAAGRVTTLALDGGACHAAEPVPAGGCAVCGGRA